jgi:hypothetical protein
VGRRLSGDTRVVGYYQKGRRHMAQARVSLSSRKAGVLNADRPAMAARRPATSLRPVTSNQAMIRRLAKDQPSSLGSQADSRRLQAKLRVGAVNDPLEREADAAADRVMRMADPRVSLSAAPTLSRKCAACEEEGKEEHPLRREAAAGGIDAAVAPPIVHDVLNSPGHPLDPATHDFMAGRFGADFSDVRIHTDAQSARSAAAVGARAYTVGRDVVFGAGQYDPSGDSGRHLLAHELAHTIQQQEGAGAGGQVQRDCDDPDFCLPYDTVAEAARVEWWIRHTYMAAEGYPTYGPEVASLYESFLDRSPGASLAPRIFSGEGSYIVRAFKGSGDTEDDMDAVIDLVGARLDRAPGPPLRDNVPRTMSLANFLSASEMNNRPINYSNPLSVAGHIAGGIGDSDAGPDYRKITYANVTLEKTTLFGSTGYVTVELIPNYEVFDAIDFCPGDCGSWFEQRITIPMSRLEASGAAYDQPFKVLFTPDTRSKRFWF